MTSPARVLLVDDDDDIREVLMDVLAAEGYRTEAAKDGLDALAKLDTGDRTLVIVLDMMMPRMDGETFLKELRSNPAMIDTPVVVISGNAAARAKAQELQAAACLMKPFELDELLHVLRRLTQPEAHVRG
jgi:CheY-like chemotaxis protein